MLFQREQRFIKTHLTMLVILTFMQSKDHLIIVQLIKLERVHKVFVFEMVYRPGGSNKQEG